MTDVLRCDVAIIGAGTAGIAAERSARANGVSTLLIDPYFDGTLCANTGCMPSKLLIAAAKEAHRVRKAEMFGISVGDVRIDGPAVMERLRSERDRFARLTRESIAELPDEILIKSRARFLGPTRLGLYDGREVQANAIIIATGAKPVMPPAFEALGDLVKTHETIFELEDLPRRLAVVGAGPIGLELSQAFARLGVEVLLFDKSDEIGKVRCKRVHETLRKVIESELSLHLGCDVEPEKTGDAVMVRWSGSESGEGEFDLVLAALGRPPYLDGLDLDKADLACDDHGVPCHDRATMRCGDSAVFIAGDVAADIPLLHEASHDGAIAGRNAAALPARIKTSRNVSFSITFTDPPTASIGNSEEDGAVTGTVDFGDQGRARVEGRNRGTLTLYAAAPDGRLIGADLCAPAGEHLAHLLAWAIETGMTASAMLELPFYHPTIEEGLKSALRTICAATPIPLPQDRDSGAPSGA